MKKIKCEVVKDFNNGYYLNLQIDGELIKDLPEYVDYKTLKKAAKDQYSLEIPMLKNLKFEKFGRKNYANLELI